MTHICKIRPPQQIRKPSSKFRRKRAVILQTSLIPEIKNKDIKLKHQRIIEKYHLQPEKQIQLARKSHSNQQKDSNTIRKERETDTLCDITDKRPNRRFYVWAISSAYDEVALTKEKEKCHEKVIRYQKETTHS